MMMWCVKLFCMVLMLFVSYGVLVVSYLLLLEGSCLVGSVFIIVVLDNNIQLLESFVVQYGQGLSNMLEVNFGVDVYLLCFGLMLIIL